MSSYRDSCFTSAITPRDISISQSNIRQGRKENKRNKTPQIQRYSVASNCLSFSYEGTFQIKVYICHG
eukprot:c51464_g1_i1 orf=135-338(+)